MIRRVRAGLQSSAGHGNVARGSIITLAMIVLSMLAACAAAETPGGSAAPTIGATPSSSPSVGGAPSETPLSSDPSTWSVTFEGIGPLRIGEPFAPDDPLLVDFGDDENTCPNPEIRYLTAAPEFGAASFVIDLDPDASFIDSFVILNGDSAVLEGIATERGVHIGASEAEARAAYPEGVSMELYPADSQGAATFPYLSVSDGAGRYILFMLGESGGAVTSISVQTSPRAVPEYCG